MITQVVKTQFNKKNIKDSLSSTNAHLNNIR